MYEGAVGDGSVILHVASVTEPFEILLCPLAPILYRNAMAQL